jgi:N-methylhydantoinase B
LVNIAVTFTVDDGRAIVNLTRFPDYAPAFINSPFANTRAAVIAAILCHNDDEQELNDGSGRPINTRSPAARSIRCLPHRLAPLSRRLPAR